MLRKNLFLLLSIAFLSCKSSSNLQILFDLPNELSEASAVEVTSKSPLIWTIQDKNNDPILYGINDKGKIEKKIQIKNATNNDWEDLSSDPSGNIYIGDFGNNDNDRQNLAIYKINHEDLSKNAANIALKTTFYYPDQKLFPPKKSNRIYDAEAFFYWDNNFYIISKNRSSGFDGTTILYKIPAKEGNFAAQKIAEFKTCSQYKSCAITSAAITSDGKKVVLLSSDKIWLFSNFTKDQFFSGNIEQLELGHFSQKEGICFKNNQTIYITDESSKKSVGKLYQYSLKN